MRQQTLADEGFERYRKRTRREQFLDEMDKIVPWKGLCEVIEPFYPKPEGAGRPPIGLQRMLRIHFLQHWFNLSDPAVEEALYDSRAMRRFVGIDLGREPAPDETTVCKFRHLLEAHNLGDQLFALIAEYLEDNGLTVNTGTIVDASIIDAPSSTKNKDRKRDPEDADQRLVLPIKNNLSADSEGFRCRIRVDHRQKMIPRPVHLKWEKGTVKGTRIDEVLSLSPHKQATKAKKKKIKKWLRKTIKPGHKMASTNFEKERKNKGFSAGLVRDVMSKLGYKRVQRKGLHPTWDVFGPKEETKD